MNKDFDIPVVYKNQQHHFKAKLLLLGSYTNKIEVDVHGVPVLFEVDEERNHRAYVDPDNKEAMDKTDTGLLEEIVTAKLSKPTRDLINLISEFMI